MFFGVMASQFATIIEGDVANRAFELFFVRVSKKNSLALEFDF
jgi:hypothetical protein